MMMTDCLAPSGGSNVPAFLAKLWTLVEDPETDQLICWTPEGASFHVFDQGGFSKEVLPKYFKHNNMASFVRQLNMYGFRKVVHMEQGGLLKPVRDDTEFQHPFFLRGRADLLENIKRKVNNVSEERRAVKLSGAKTEEVRVRQDNVGQLLTDVQIMRGKQESIDCRLLAMKHENEALWREVAGLRQKHNQQQKVVNKLIQFLISLVQSNQILGMKRKIPLMLNDSSPAHSLPKYSRQLSLEHVGGAAALPASFSAYADSARFSPDSSPGPIISDVTELAHSSPSGSPGPDSPVVLIKEEPLSPCSPPGSPQDALSPSTFIDSILQENQRPDGDETSTREPCLSLARLDRPVPELCHLFPGPSSSSLQSRSEPGGELTDHVDVMDSGLETLQSIFNSHSFSMDPSTLLDLFSSALIAPDLPLPDLDSSLASIQELLSSQGSSDSEADPADAGKQIVHYTGQPLILMNTAGAELPILLELEGEELVSDYAPEEAGSSLPALHPGEKSGDSGIS